MIESQGCRLTIIDHKREEVVHSAPIGHLEVRLPPLLLSFSSLQLVTAIDESLWISFDDLRKNPDEYFSLESINAREILNYFRELREKVRLPSHSI